MVEIVPRWDDKTPYKVFKYKAAGNPKEIGMTFTELGIQVNEYRRNKRNRDTERAVAWYVDTLIHYSARQRAWLNPEVISNLRPLAYESLFIPNKKDKVVILHSPHPHCDVASGFIDLPFLHKMWGFRRSALYVYHLALYLGTPPELHMVNTAVDLVIGPKSHHLDYLSFLYWAGRRKGLTPFDQTLHEFKRNGIRGKTKEQVRREFFEVYCYVEFMLNAEFPEGLPHE